MSEAGGRTLFRSAERNLLRSEGFALGRRGLGGGVGPGGRPMESARSDVVAGRPRAGLKVLVPGYAQWSWRQRERGLVLFGSFAAALAVGGFAWGTRTGLAVLAFAFGTHVVSVVDVIRQSAFPGFGRWVPLFSASTGLGVAMYAPALALASLVAWPAYRGGSDPRCLPGRLRGLPGGRAEAGRLGLAAGRVALEGDGHRSGGGDGPSGGRMGRRPAPRRRGPRGARSPLATRMASERSGLHRPRRACARRLQAGRADRCGAGAGPRRSGRRDAPGPGFIRSGNVNSSPDRHRTCLPWPK